LDFCNPASIANLGFICDGDEVEEEESGTKSTIKFQVKPRMGLNNNNYGCNPGKR